MRYRPKRVSCNVTVAVHTGSGIDSARLTSVSSTGALLQGIRGLRKGLAVTVRSNGMDFPGRVIWVSSERAGIEFDEPQTRVTLNEAGFRDTAP